MPHKGAYLRLDTLSPVPADAQILWGPAVQAVEVNRHMLFRERGNGRVPYMALSTNRALRVVEEGTLDARVARLAALEIAQGGCWCLSCCAPLNAQTAQIEHLIPVSAGGPDHISNLALCCASCNRQMADLPVVAKVRLAVRARHQALQAGFWDPAPRVGPYIDPNGRKAHVRSAGGER